MLGTVKCSVRSLLLKKSELWIEKLIVGSSFVHLVHRMLETVKCHVEGNGKAIVRLVSKSVWCGRGVAHNDHRSEILGRNPMSTRPNGLIVQNVGTGLGG